MSSLARLALLLALLAASATGAGATQPDEILADPALEARARAIGADLRCLVCQNEAIDESSAPLARDLRILLRERLVAGDSDEQAIAYIVDRYGDYVLLKPPFKATTLLLWAAPLLALGAGGLIVLVMVRRRTGDPAAAEELSAAERKRLATLVGQGGKGGSRP